MYTFNHIRTFVHVVEMNNFSRAAKALNLTVAAVSKHVSQLEAELGIELLQRTTRKLVLTEIGHQYYLQCKNIMHAIDTAESIVKQTQDEPSGILTVHCEPYFADRYVVPKLPEFQKKYPKVNIDLYITDSGQTTIDEKIDLFFGKSAQQIPAFSQKVISKTHFTLCASPKYLEKKGTPQKPKDLLQHDYLSHSRRQPVNCIKFEHGEQVFIEPRLLLNDSNSLLACALNDMGFVKLQHYVVAESIKQGKLVELLTQYPNPPISLSVFYQPEKILQTKVKAFINHICEDLPEEL